MWKKADKKKNSAMSKGSSMLKSVAVAGCKLWLELLKNK